MHVLGKKLSVHNPLSSIPQSGYRTGLHIQRPAEQTVPLSYIVQSASVPHEFPTAETKENNDPSRVRSRVVIFLCYASTLQFYLMNYLKA